MGDRTKIEWTRGPDGTPGATWNPIRGCSRVSEGCRNCYAETVANRFSGPGMPYEGLVNDHGRWNGTVREVPTAIDQPLRWRKPRRIFVNSMSDLFHESLSDDAIDRIFAVMALAKQHTFQVLTKRPDRMRRYLTFDDGVGTRADLVGAACRDRIGYGAPLRFEWPLPNVWLGVSVENQEAADKRIPDLLGTPAAVQFLSCEPLLGPVELESVWLRSHRDPPIYSKRVARERNGWLGGIDWVIVGGESGPNARPMHPGWARALRDQCLASHVPFHFKQFGEWAPANGGPGGDLLDGIPLAGRASGFFDYSDRWNAGDFNPFRQSMVRLGKHAAGRELDGRTWDQFPAVSP